MSSSPKYPVSQAPSMPGYADGYLGALATALSSLDRDALARAARILQAAIDRRSFIYACGNGGSAAIANHLMCDCLKGVQTGTQLRPRVVSLSSNVEILTATANDISYDEVFVFPLRTMAMKGDVLLTISSSGNSENIVRALQWARDNGLPTIAMTGFQGGRSAQIADAVLHIPASNYGIVEDAHQACMHMLAQYLRQSAMTSDLVGGSTF
jgi:phosphoheptose isomerase